MPPDVTAAPDGFARELGPGGLEHRTVPTDVGQIRAEDDDDERWLAGYGTVFGRRYRMGRWTEWDEEIVAGAFEEAIADGDVRSMMNHDTNWLLGRQSAGTLTVAEDDTGLRYEVQINADDPNAMSVHARVARGDIDGSSIWFVVEQQTWTYPTDANDLEVPLRQITKVNPLYEVGPVVFPANTAADVGLRALDRLLSAVGVDRAGARADLAAELTADPDRIETRLTELLDGAPQLRDAVCSCSTDPAGGGRSLAGGDDTGVDTDVDDQRRLMAARGLAARTGLPLTIDKE